MGQSSSGSSGTAQTPIIAPSVTQTPQQKLAGSAVSRLVGPGTTGGKILSALPVDSEAKTRIAGDVFNAFAGPDTTAAPASYDEQIKYLKQGMASATTGNADGYTGS